MPSNLSLFATEEYSTISTGWHSDKWETPPPVARFMAKLLMPHEYRILEPSAGRGAIAKHLPNGATCVELDVARCEEGAVPHQDWICGDFLKYAQRATEQFDVVIGNPPFSRGIEFIKAAAKVCKDEGRILYLLPTEFFQSQERASQFLDSGLIISQQWQIAGRIGFEQEGVVHNNRQCYDSVFEIRDGRRCEAKVKIVDPYERLA